VKQYHQHLENFFEKLKALHLGHWQPQLQVLTQTALDSNSNGNIGRWLPALNAITQYPNASEIELNQSAIYAKTPSLSKQDQVRLESYLKALMPWRKGPFQINQTVIDTEWRSDWKWDRVLPHLSPLTDRKVLDIGCGSGYHLWRMLGAGAKAVVGVGPSLLFMTQFLTIKHFIGKNTPAYFLPFTLEQLPKTEPTGMFDTVFSMGVLYHRRSPIDHLIDLKRYLKPGGELILETLVIPEQQGQLLVPKDRYAQMNNVWFIPSVRELTRWLEKCGYKNVRCVDVDQTSTDEQRTTEWMDWKSLADFLDPHDNNKTIEGYSAPLRAVIIANKPV